MARCDGVISAVAAHPRWARFFLIMVPNCVIYLQLLGILLDGCRSEIYVSDTMDEDYCLHEVEGQQAVPSASARLNRWLVWNYFFLCEALKRQVFLPKSITRNVFAGLYCGCGLCAMYFYGGAAHVIFGTAYMLTGVLEVSVLWYPIWDPCCPACCHWLWRRPGSMACDRKRRCGAIAIGVYIWAHALALIFTLSTPILGLLPHIVLFGSSSSSSGSDANSSSSSGGGAIKGGVRLNVVLEWTLVTAFQIIHWCRVPALAASNLGELRPLLSSTADLTPSTQQSAATPSKAELTTTASPSNRAAQIEIV